MEHDCWRGPNNQSKPRRIANGGYSHHRQTQHPDYKGFTQEILRAVIRGNQKGDSFFTTVANYFDAKHRSDFWENVLFFNFLPRCIGTTEDMFATASDEIHKAGSARFMRIIRAEKPAKIFVFSTKAWKHCPLIIQEE